MSKETKIERFSVRKLAEIIKAEPVDAPDTFFVGISTDSRTIRQGECFFAIKGEKFDGHDHLAEAFARGAACAVVSKKTSFCGRGLLRVSDTIKALGDFAAWYRRENNFKVIAVTGSVGKTTTRHIIYQVLSRHFRVRQAPKNFNNHIGVPLTLLGAAADDEIVIAELGSSRPGEISYLARIAQPDIAVLTNIRPAHLSGFGDFQTIVREKLSIGQGLNDDGVLIINAEVEPWLDSKGVGIQRLTTFGTDGGSEVQAENIHLDAAGSRFAIEGVEINLPLPGRGNVENALAAWAVCRSCGVSLEDFAEAIKNITAVPMRAEILQAGTLTVINDCYNANPASMENALEILSRIAASENRRAVFVCGDMAELGSFSVELHKQLGSMIVKAGVRLLLAVGEFAEIVADSAASGSELDIKTFEHTAELCNNLNTLVKDDDVILVKGSRAAGLEKVVDELTKSLS